MVNSNNKVDSNKLLVLLPHCIQASDCSVKITHDVDNCQICGKCDIGEILKLKHKYEFQLYIATGGTAARAVVKNVRPKGILAVACERDLSSGIIDCEPLPVLGVLNNSLMALVLILA